MRRLPTWQISSSSEAPASTTSRTSPSTCRATPSSSSPGCPARASRPWPSTRSSPRASAATSSRCRRTPASSSARWTSPTSTSSRGCRPAVSIDQKSTSKNPRSTVGTITEVYDYLRLLYARAGRPHCPICGAPDRAADPAADRRPGPGARGGRPVPGAGPGDPRPQGRVRRAVPAAPDPGLLPGPGRRRDLRRSTTRPRSTSRRSTPSRWSSTGSRSRRPPSGGSPTRSRPRSTWPAGWCVFDFVDLAAKDPGRELRFSEKMACPNDHPIDTDELEPRSFSFNSPVRRLPRVPRPRHPDGGRPRAGRPRPAGDARRGRDPAVEPGPRRRLLPAADGRARRGARLRPQHALGGPPGQGAEVAARRAPDQGPRRHPQPLRPRARLLRRVRGRAAPTSSAGTARPSPTPAGSASRASCARCPARPARAAGSSRSRWRSPSATRTRGGRNIAEVCALPINETRRLPARPRAERPGAPDRRAGAQGDPGAAQLPARRRPRLPLPRPALRARCPAARRSGSGWPPRSAPAWSASSTSSTSRRSGCTSATTSG